MKTMWMVLAGAVTGALVLAVGDDGALMVRATDVPPGLFVGERSALAYVVEGGPPSRYGRASFPLRSLRREGTDDQTFILLAHSNGRYWPVSSRRDADAIVAEVARGPVYVVVEHPIDHLALTFNLLCRFKAAADRWPERKPVLPKLCTQILCAPERVEIKTLLKEFGVPGLDPGPGTGGFGGWTTVPRDLCAECTRPGPGVAYPVPPTLPCLVSPGTTSCSAGTPLFSDDFTSDSTGSPPASSPVGVPPDDSVTYTGNVSVASVAAFGGNAVRLARTTRPTRLDAILGAGATNGGSYCISFRGVTEIPDTSIVISLLSAADRPAWQLRIGAAGSSLSSGLPGPQSLPSSLTTPPPHDFRFDLDLDAAVFNLSIDGASVAVGLPLLSPDFTTPERIRFDYIPMILEGFPGTYVVDDIRLRKTN